MQQVQELTEELPYYPNAKGMIGVSKYYEDAYNHQRSNNRWLFLLVALLSVATITLSLMYISESINLSNTKELHRIRIENITNSADDVCRNYIAQVDQLVDTVNTYETVITKPHSFNANQCVSSIMLGSEW